MRIAFALAFIAASASALELLYALPPCPTENDTFESCRANAWKHNKDMYANCIS